MCFGSQYEDNFKKKMAGAGVSRWAGRGKKSKFLAGVTRKNRERSGGGGGDWPGAGGMNPGAAICHGRGLGLLRYLRIPTTVPPRQVALDMTHTSQGPGPALLLRHKAVALEFLPMGAQLLLKAALPLAGILATASDRCRKTGAAPDSCLPRRGSSKG